MVAKRKDFQKTALHIHELLLKLGDEPDCAELRDSLNLSLLHMQRYFQVLRHRRRGNSGENLGSTSSTMGEGSLTALSPMSPYTNKSDKFTWHWRRNRTSGEQNYHRGHHLQASSSESIHNMEDAQNPVLRCLEEGDFQLMATLCQQDRNHLKACDIFNRTLVMYAVKYEQVEALEWLLNHGANVNCVACDGSTALMLACYYGYMDATELLLSYGATVNVQDNMGRAPIHWACAISHCDCLKCLIKYGANVNIRDEEGLTPAMWSCHVDNIEHFRILSEVANQKIDEPDGIERDNCGRTWMHWAVRRTEPLECLSTLLTVETAVLREDSGKTVMLLAAEIGSLAACQVIVDVVGADCIHDRDDQDRTPLHLATLGGHGEVVNFLMERGGDLEARDKNNCTPWTYANNRHLHYCKLIISSHYRQRSRSVDSRASTQTNSTANYGWDPDWKPRTPPRPPKTPPLKLDRSPTLRRSLKRNTDISIPLAEGANHQSETNDDTQTPESVDNHVFPEAPHKSAEPQRDMEDDVRYERANNRNFQPLDATSSYSPSHQADPTPEQRPSRRFVTNSGPEHFTSNDWNDQEIPPSHAKVLVIHPSSADSRSTDEFANDNYGGSPVYSRDPLQSPEQATGRLHGPNILSRSQQPHRIQNSHSEELYKWNDPSSKTGANQETSPSKKSTDRVPRPRQRQAVPQSSVSNMEIEESSDKFDHQKPPETPPEMRRRPAVPTQLIPLEVSSNSRSTSEDRNRYGTGTFKKHSKKRKAQIPSGSSDEFHESSHHGSSAWSNNIHSSPERERAVIEEVIYSNEKYGDENSRKNVSNPSTATGRQARILHPPPMSISPRNVEPIGPPVLQPQGPGQTRQSQLLSVASSNNIPHDPMKGPTPPMAPGPLDSLRNSVSTWNTSNGGGSTPRHGTRNDSTYTNSSPRNHLQDYDGSDKNALSLPPALHPRLNKKEISGHKTNDPLFGHHHSNVAPLHSQMTSYTSYHN